MIVLESLTDHLFHFNISEKDALILFDISVSTFKRWNKKPPSWVINIIKMIGSYKVLPTAWDGWYFNDEFLCDDAGNKYSQNDIKAIFFTKQSINSLIGNQSNVISLKSELEKKIKTLKSEISISLVTNGEVIENKVFKL